jgi:hypothetical protein
MGSWSDTRVLEQLNRGPLDQSSERFDRRIGITVRSIFARSTAVRALLRREQRCHLPDQWMIG